MQLNRFFSFKMKKSDSPGILSKVFSRVQNVCIYRENKKNINYQQEWIIIYLSLYILLLLTFTF